MSKNHNGHELVAAWDASRARSWVLCLDCKAIVSEQGRPAPATVGTGGR